ncbi:MAG: hypothetical protein WCH98_20475, partial [Verrucomicrobiota bacterium]
MNSTESRILSILRPGEMLRFSLRPAKARKIEFGIEGASTSREKSALLSARLGLLLAELRGTGYMFGERLTGLKCASAARKSSSRQPRSRPIWIEIEPRTVSGAPPRLGCLGFRSPSVDHV